MKLNTALSVLAAVGLGGVAVANDPTTASTAASHDKTKLVSKLADKNIESTDRAKLGEIEDFVVDESGQITHAVVSYGSTLGLGGKQTVVPWDVLSSSMQGEQIVLERTRLENAPVITDQELVASTTWRTEIDQHWEQGSDESMRTAEAPAGSMTDSSSSGSSSASSDTATSDTATSSDTEESATGSETGPEAEGAMGTHESTSTELEPKSETTETEQTQETETAPY
jgi:sporulation protein YlmC with PRC-barrel domain